MITTAEAALRLGCSARRVRALIDEGRLRGERVSPRLTLVDSATVAALERLRGTRRWG
jgi:excisionase family DNA binding protein